MPCFFNSASQLRLFDRYMTEAIIANFTMRADMTYVVHICGIIGYASYGWGKHVWEIRPQWITRK